MKESYEYPTQIYFTQRMRMKQRIKKKFILYFKLGRYQTFNWGITKL